MEKIAMPDEIKIPEKMRIEEARQSAEMILSPERWPRRPRLFVKRRPKYQGEWPECGFVMEGQHAGPVVIRDSIYTDGSGGLKTIATYESVDEMVADLWIVD